MRARVGTALLATFALLFASVGLGRSQELRVIHDIVFATVDGVELTLDVYQPEQAGPFPAVIAIHGGSWHGGDKSIWRTSAPALVEAGTVVYAIDYRLAPPGGNGRFRDAPSDVRLAIDWVRRNGATYGTDASRIALLGSSAGGHLALVAARAEGDGLRAVAAWSPATNLIALARGPLATAVASFIGCSYGSCPRRYRIMSPVKRVRAENPPTLLAGSTDELMPRGQGRTMAARLLEAGVHAEHLEIPGTAHGQALRDAVLADTAAFLKGQLEQR